MSADAVPGGEPSVRDDPAVRRWIRGAGHGELPDGDRQRYLGVLTAFVAHTGKSPSELVAFCFLRKRDTGERFVSAKRRIVVNEWIEAFVAERGWADKQAVVNANIVRGFLIHNGVLIQGRIWRS